MRTTENFTLSEKTRSFEGIKPAAESPGAGISAIPEICYKGGRQYPRNRFIVGKDGEKYYLEHTVWDKYY